MSKRSDRVGGRRQRLHFGGFGPEWGICPLWLPSDLDVETGDRFLWGWHIFDEVIREEEMKFLQKAAWELVNHLRAGARLPSLLQILYSDLDGREMVELDALLERLERTKL